MLVSSLIHGVVNPANVPALKEQVAASEISGEGAGLLCPLQGGEVVHLGLGAWREGAVVSNAFCQKSLDAASSFLTVRKIQTSSSFVPCFCLSWDPSA